MYKYPSDSAGDVGWLYPGETLSEDQYWTSLQWYNTELLRDSYVIGGALFNVGPPAGGRPSATWASTTRSPRSC